MGPGEDWPQGLSAHGVWGGGGGSATRDLGTSGARDLGHRGDRLFSEGLLAPAWRASPQRCRVDVRVSTPFPGCHVMSLRNPWTPEGLFSSLIHNRPESGSESRVRRGRRMDENIAHADGRIASAGQGKATEDPRAAPGSAGSARHTRTGPARSHSHGVPEQSHADTGRGCGPRAGREGEHAPHPAPQASPGRPPHVLVLPELRPRLPWRALGRHPVQMRVAAYFSAWAGSQAPRRPLAAASEGFLTFQRVPRRLATIPSPLHSPWP